MRILFDSGVSAAKVLDRLSAHGVGPIGADAVIISHDHWDHVSSIKAVCRKFSIPLYISQPTFSVISRRWWT